MRARRLPGDDDRCGWWQLLPPPAPPRRLQREVEADCVVVGAGFTGRAIACRLAELRPGWRIALPHPSWIPSEPFLGVGVRAATAFLSLRAGSER
jgi:hypothetical protein